MRRSRCEPGLCTPGVSTKTICAAGCMPLRASTSTTPAMRLRVVCGLAETMATFSPVSALSSVLFPALGRPRMATNPDRKGVSAPEASLRHLVFGRIPQSSGSMNGTHVLLAPALGRGQILRGQCRGRKDAQPLHAPICRGHNLDAQTRVLQQYHLSRERDAPLDLADQASDGSCFVVVAH